MPWIAVVIAVHCLGLAMLLWALRGRSPRSGVRCPRCGYDMAGVPEEDGALLCPECGRRAPVNAWARPGEAWRYSHRSRRAIAAAILVQVGLGYYWHQRRAGYESWIGLMPDWALVRLGEGFPNGDSLIVRSLNARWNKGHLSRGHMAYLCERYIARPPESAHAAPRVRPRWPADLPVVLGVTPGWWGYAIVNGNELWEQGVEPAWAEWDDWKGAPREVLHPWGGVYVFGPTVHAGTNRVPVTLEQTIPASPIAGVAWSQRVESTVAFEGVSSIEECMTPVDNRDIRRRIVNGLTISASRPGSGEGWDRLTKLTFHFEPEWEPSAVDYTIAVRITIEHEGRVLAEHRDNETYLRRFSDLELPDRDIGEDPAWGPLLIKDGTGINLDGVIIRIRPDPLGALAYLAYDKFWSGEIILDARDVIAVEPHPYDME